MRLVLFLVFVAVPLIELALIIRVGQVAGFWPTLAMIVAMAVAGTVLLQRQGVGVMRRASDALATGEAPVAAVVDGVFIFVAGLLLVTPGFLSDALGLMLLIPPVRRVIARKVIARVLASDAVEVRTWQTGSVQTGSVQTGSATSKRSRSGKRSSGGFNEADRPVVIETEYERVDETTIEPKREDS